MEATDSYSAGKSQLRDTIKWLATTVAGLTAVVVGGTPFSGLGSLPLASWRFLLAIVALLGASGFLLVVWARLIHLMRPDAGFASRLLATYDVKAIEDPVERDEIESLRGHLDEVAVDLFPSPIGSLDELWERREQAFADGATEEWSQFDTDLRMVLSYAAFAKLHHRFTVALPIIKQFTLLALVCLCLYAWAANPGKDTKPDQLVILQSPVERSSTPTPSFEPVRFASGQWQLEEEGLVAIGRVRDFLKAHTDVGVLLMTYTDTRGESNVNGPLARHRGQTVRETLISQGGIPPNRIFISELPETALPVITGQQMARPENRSVEFVVVQLPRP